MIDYVFITQIPPRHEGKPAVKDNKESFYFNKIKENYASKELSLTNFLSLKSIKNLLVIEKQLPDCVQTVNLVYTKRKTNSKQKYSV